VTLTRSHPRPWPLTGGGDRGHAAKPTRHHRTRPIDGHEETTAAEILGPTKAFGAFVRALLLARGFQLLPKASGREGGRLPRHSHSARIRLDGLPSGRRQGPTGPAVGPVLPPFVWRERQRRPAVARAARLAPPGGRRLAGWAGSGPRAPLALSRVSCARGQPRWGTGWTRWARSLPGDRWAAETPSPSDRHA
jgi:hypothetical protein